MSTVLAFDGVTVAFARGTPRTRAARLAGALAAAGDGRSRADIEAAFDVLVAVRHVSLEVARGECCVIVGPSGSGKSTLLRAANRLTPIAAGHVYVGAGVEAIDVARCDADTLREVRRRRLAMVFQQFALLPHRTVAENIAFGLELRGDPPDRRRDTVQAQLTLMGLDGWGPRRTSELSGGMQQRVGIARALATGADILLLDEPFSALDAPTRRRLQDELRDLLQRLRQTMVFVTHDLDEAARLGDRIVLLDEGTVLQVGTLDDLRRAPASAAVERFVSAM